VEWASIGPHQAGPGRGESRPGKRNQGASLDVWKIGRRVGLAGEEQGGFPDFQKMADDDVYGPRGNWTEWPACNTGSSGDYAELHGFSRNRAKRIKEGRGGEFFIYLICHDFRKIIDRTKILEKYTSGAVAHDAWSPAVVRHGGRGAANGRQYWPVGPGPNVEAHGVRKS
jgi:hypothetical protein